MTDPMLGRHVAVEEYGRLETFRLDRPVRIKFLTDELQALCPAIDGIQPDIYHAEIEYTAVTHAIESKSLKLFLVTFRERRIFGEHLAFEIYDAIVAFGSQVSDVRVFLRQNARGGIVTEVTYPAA